MGDESGRGQVERHPMSNPSIRLEADRLDIEHLSCADDCVIEYVQQFAVQQRASAVLNCLQLGARALSFARSQSSTTLLVDAMKSSTESTQSLLQLVSKETRDSVARSADELPKKLQSILKILEKDLTATLDPKSASSIVGRLHDALVAGIIKETAKLADSLDLRNPKSHLSQLGAQLEKQSIRIEGQLQQITAELHARTAANEVRRKTTGKGVVFEDILEAHLANESRPRHDIVTRTSKARGIDGNDVGDVTIEVAKDDAHGAGLIIAVEAKDASVSLPALIREVEKAMRNRGAAFGIGVTTNESISKGSSLIIPAGDDKLVVCAPRVAEGEFELLGVTIALEMARWKAIMGRNQQTDSMDLNRINAHVVASLNVLKRFIEAKRRMTTVKTSVDDAWDFIDGIRGDLQTELGHLRVAIAEELDHRSPGTAA